uniref:N-acetylneuraminate lyase n=1 Tax=Periophthalmus magnuspinnatus TaxID=409849 RepID=A0A3B3Z981_9GOBI
MAPAAETRMTGVVAATFTPLTPEGEINLSVIGPYIDYLIEKQNVKSIFVNGTTGESVSLSLAERKALAEDWCHKAKGKMDQVIVHVGCMCLRDSQELACHAAQIGADGIAVISPSFFKPSTAAFLREVASAAPTLPFYYYHLPAMTGVNGNYVLNDIEELVPSFRGIKFSGCDLMDFGQCVSKSRPHWAVVYGVDEQLLAGLAMGANGAVGSTYNYVGSYMNKLMTAFENGDQLQARAIQVFSLLLLLFQLMSDVSGLSLGPPRLPLVQCPQDYAKSIFQKYNSLFQDSR